MAADSPYAARSNRREEVRGTDLNAIERAYDGRGQCLRGVRRLSPMKAAPSSPECQREDALTAAASVGGHIIGWAELPATIDGLRAAPYGGGSVPIGSDKDRREATVKGVFVGYYVSQAVLVVTAVQIVDPH